VLPRWDESFQKHNGDIIALHLDGDGSAPVAYLSHDDGEGHGRVLGWSVLDFLDRWTLLGCPGPEDWQMLPFMHPDAPYLDPEGENARAWRAWMGLRFDG